MMSVLYILLLILAALYLLRLYIYGYWSRQGIPFDPPFLIFGSFFDIVSRKKHLNYCIRAIYDRFQALPCVGIYIFYRPLLMIRSPALIRSILVKDFDKFVNRSFASNEKVDPIAFHTIFSAQGAEWKSLRNKLTPVFTSGKMKLMFPLMEECAADLVSVLETNNGQVTEVKELVKRYSVDVISSCAFGMNSNCIKKPKDNTVFEMSKKLLDPSSFVRGFSVMCFFFIPKFVDWFRLTFLDKEACQFFVDMFNFGLKERQEKKVNRNDLFQILDTIKNDDKDGNYEFDNVKMVAQAISFFSAGNDTTALSIVYTLYELALNKDVQTRTRLDINEMMAKHGGINYESIQNMKYLDMVLSETLRMYPFASILNRESSVEHTFENGFKIEKDVAILIPVSGLHFDPEYFPEPEKFDPERFSEMNKSKIVPYTYLPFGDGPRNCIGQRFGLLATKVALANVLRCFTIDLCNETVVPIVFHPGSMFLQNKEGIFLKVAKI